MTSEASRSAVLVLAPIGRDAKTSASLIEQLGFDAVICPDLASLEARLVQGGDVVLIAEEALYGKGLGGLAAWVAAQPPWSDQPFLVLTNQNAGLNFANSPFRPSRSRLPSSPRNGGGCDSTRRAYLDIQRNAAIELRAPGPHAD
jgi:hypothetical protein